jgi:Tfp pilus assembly protein PilV
MKKTRGVTLVELMVAACILSIGIVSLVGTFQYLTVMFQSSKLRILANNLAQEKVEVLKNLPYYALEVTSNPYANGNYNPQLLYDSPSGYYAPESLTVSGVTFTRAVRVDFAAIQSGALTALAPTSEDPGLKQISVYVMWKERNQNRYIALSNLLENPNVAPLDATISGTVTSTTSVGLPGTLVFVAENPDWRMNAGAGGAYSLAVHHGSYTIVASSTGYFDAHSTQQNVVSGSAVNVNLQLTKQSLGTVAGSVWTDDHLIISQVVGSSLTTAGAEQEWVEVYNPTTFTWTMTNVGLSHWRSHYGATAQNIVLDYTNTTLGPGQYFLIANLSTITVGGVNINPDAYYDYAANNANGQFNHYTVNTGPNIIMTNDVTSHGEGAVLLTDLTSGNNIDIVGWNGSAGTTPQFYNGTQLNPSAGGGLSPGEQFVRICSTNGYSTTYGPSYNSLNNIVDFNDIQIMTVLPSNTLTAARTAIAGTPAVGAKVTINDGLSVVAQSISVGNPPAATFAVPNVATGTWSVDFIYNGTYYQNVASATIATDGQTLYVPNAATAPVWPAAGVNAVQLTSSTTNGFLDGHIYDGIGNGLSGITVMVGATTVTSGTGGYYFVSVSTGDQNVRVNPNNANSNYVEEDETVGIAEGVVIDSDVYLSNGGTVKGYLTSGTSPIASINVAATQSGTQFGSAVTDASGYFYIRNLSTGTYDIGPALDPASTSNPFTNSVTIVAGTTVSAGTFTVTGAYGTVAGTVKKGSNYITSGVIVVISSQPIPSTPAAIYANSSPANTVFYMSPSDSDGNYSVLVRGTTTFTYYISAYYPTPNANSTVVTVTTQSVSGVSVAPGGSVTRNFSF